MAPLSTWSFIKDCLT